MRRKLIHLLALVAVIVSIMACSLAGGGSGDDTVPMEETATVELGGAEETVVPREGIPVTGRGLCANAYYPVREGATWTYASSSSITEDFGWTDTITDIRDNGFTLTTEFENLTRTQEWSCKSEGLVTLELGGGPAGSLTTSQANLDLITQNVTGVTYPVEISTGSQWSHSHEFMGTMDIARQSAEAEGNEQANFTAIGLESVTVPAGTFDAMKVEVETTINFNSTFQGTTIPLTFTGMTTSWYAQGVGWVKSVSMSNFGGESYTETIELQSYSIP